MEKIYYTITTESLKRWDTEDVNEAIKAFHSDWQVVKTTIMKTFTKHSVVKVDVATEITDESEIR